jgi:hypothetical protein
MKFMNKVFDMLKIEKRWARPNGIHEMFREA